MANHIFVGDIGTNIKLTTGQDISTATVTQIKYKKPTGTTGYWTATIEDSSATSYLLQTSDIDTSGIWYVNSYVEIGGWKGRGKTARLNVKAQFEE